MPVPSHIQTEDKSFVRETSSRGLLCVDKNALERHRRKLASSQDHAKIAQQYANLEARVNELTDMVRIVLARLNEKAAS